MSSDDKIPIAPYPPLVVNRSTVIRSSLQAPAATGQPDQEQVEDKQNVHSARVRYLSPDTVASINTGAENIKGSVLLSILSLDFETLSVTRGNPSLGNAASTCLDVRATASSSMATVLTGLSTGALCVHQIMDTSTTSAIASTDYYHAPKHHRSATSVKWRPQHSHAAIGLELASSPGSRQRSLGRPSSGDHCCLLWDLEGGRRSRNAPIIKLSHQVGVNSLAWLSEHILSIGSQNRNIQIFDLRSDVSPITIYAHNFGVDGIEHDPHHSHQFASFCQALNEPVKVWDNRRLDKAIQEIRLRTDASFEVSAIKWATNEPDLLCIANADFLLEYNTAGSRPTLVSSTQASSRISDFELYPFQREGTLKEELLPQTVLFAYEHNLERLPRKPIAPLAISPRNGDVIHGVKHILWSHPQNYKDVSTIMRRRASCKNKHRYSMDTQSNIRLLRGEGMEDEATRENLIRLWSWIHQVESLVQDEMDILVGKDLQSAGALRLLSENDSILDTEGWSEMLALKTYTSPARRAVLASFGWTGENDLTYVMESCMDMRDYERAAALAIWHGDIGEAVKCLQSGSSFYRSTAGKDDSNYSEILERVALCVAGFRGGDTTSPSAGVWKDAAKNLFDKLTSDPLRRWGTKYLCGLLRFLLSLGSETALFDVLNDSSIGLSDRVALACRFLSFSELLGLIQTFISACKFTGNVEGLTMTGFDREGMKILQSYVDRTADVQSATLLSSRCIYPAAWKAEREVSNEWLDSYRSLLNVWRMWQSRAMFDVDRADLLRKVKLNQSDNGRFRGAALQGRRTPPGRPYPSTEIDPDIRAFVPAQIDIRCNFCSSTIGLNQKDNQRNQWLTKMNPILSCCPHCRKPLPRCAVCMLSLGTINPYLELTRERSRRNSPSSPDDLSSLANLPFAEWITFCMKCKHGGHSHHMVGWFAMHESCPVSGCDCNCQFDARA